MKTLLAAIAFGLASAALAQSGHDSHQPVAHAHQATGVVTKTDAANGKVTIRHEAVPSLKWPAMTMAFAVKDPALMNKLSKGTKVEFEFRQEGRDYVVTSVK